MQELMANVNWLAVVVGAVVAYLLGWLWFSPKLFGKKWALGVGLSPEGPDKMPMAAMTLQAVGTFLLAWVVGVTAAMNSLATIFLIVITFAVLQMAGGHFSQKSSYAIAAEAGFMVAMVIVMIIVQGIF